jgi:hypothetical protein
MVPAYRLMLVERVSHIHLSKSLKLKYVPDLLGSLDAGDKELNVVRVYLNCFVLDLWTARSVVSVGISYFNENQVKWLGPLGWSLDGQKMGFFY